ncbi:MAG: response regulator [Epsilonproteobacteria bacterium]|nr:response regulator [Campylobacterota bacterium]
MSYRYLIAVWTFLVSLQAAPTCEKIILATFSRDIYAQKSLTDFNQTLRQDQKIAGILNRGSIRLRVRPSGEAHIVVLEPITRHETAMRLLTLVRQRFPDAFANTNPPSFCESPEKKAVPSSQTHPPIQKTLSRSDTLPPEENKTTPLRLDRKQKLSVPEPKRIRSAPTLAKTARPPEQKAPLPPKYPPQVKSKSDTPLLWALLAVGTALLLLLLRHLFYGRKRLQALREEKNLYQKKFHGQQVFLAKVLHELRAPVNAVIGLSEHLKEHRLPPEQETYVRQIHQAGQMQLSLINDLSDFTKLSIGRFTVTPAEFNINEILARVRGVVALQASAKGIDLAFDIDPDVPDTFFGDPVRIEQIFINLLNNAIKFTEQGGVELKISSSHRKENGEITLKAVIRDTGIGMKPEQLANLFDDIDLNEESIRQIFGGTGLGLSIVKQLVDAMGGTVRAESEWGKGSTFYLTLPLHTGDSDKRRRYRLPSKTFMGKKAVIVDTHARSAAALRKMLQYFRYEVVVEPSLEKAMDHATKRETDLLFIDENYLGEQTIALLDTIRQNWPITIVVVESFGNKKRNRAMLPHVRHFLVRPFTQKEILDLIIRVFGKQRG